MDPYLYAAGMRGESFKIDDISELDEFARKAEEINANTTINRETPLKWVTWLIARFKEISSLE